MAFFTEIEQTILKFIGSNKRPEITKLILRENNRDEGIAICILNYNTKTVVLKTAFNGTKNNGHIDQWNRINSPEVNPNIYVQLIFLKGDKKTE